jgi:hypothetical protein
MGQYLIGNQVRLSVDITNTAGVATDPANLTLQVKNRTTGVITIHVYLTDVNLIRDSAGHYHYDYTPTVVAYYDVRWSCTGAVIVASEDSFTITASAVI